MDIRQVVNKVLDEEEVRRKQQCGNEEEGPATTWPLGEILAARHDQLHSRIFNS